MDEQEQFHHHQLAKHCRICGSRQQKPKSKVTTYDCTGYREELLQVFQVDTSSDTEDTHPTQFCHCGYCAMWRAMTARAKGAPYTTSVITYEWQQHSSDCRVSAKSQRLLLNIMSLRCSICLEVYQCPVEMQCGTLVCAACCSHWVQVTAGVSCFLTSLATQTSNIRRVRSAESDMTRSHVPLPAHAVRKP